MESVATLDKTRNPFAVVRPMVFWPPIVLLLLAASLSLKEGENFVSVLSAANDWVIAEFGWLFSLGTLCMLLTCVWVYFSPIGAITIGGKGAKPMLTRWRWFTITLCTTVAVGILFWGSAEPLYHLHSPPNSLGIASESPQAALFSLSTLFLHWSFTPYAIYTVPAVMFALAFYNLKKPYSTGASLTPLFGDRAVGKGAELIDAVCLYALVAGMAGSLGAGLLTLAGGFHYFFGWERTPQLLGFISLTIVVSFVASAATGLMKGIRVLSDINVKIFFAIGVFVFLTGPTNYILSFATEAFGRYVAHFFESSLFTGAVSDDPWPKSWTIFYWANWLAWAPITALFLGRISYGYTVRQFILITLVAPSLFACVWMAIFGGTAIYFDNLYQGALHSVLLQQGPEGVIYRLFSEFPLAGFMAAIFILTAFISYVTASDSNTEAMGSISTKSDGKTGTTGSVLWVKVVWGALIGIVSWIMVSFAGIDGIKMLSNLGGLPALFLILLVNASLIKIIVQHKRFFSSPVSE